MKLSLRSFPSFWEGNWGGRKNMNKNFNHRFGMILRRLFCYRLTGNVLSLVFATLFVAFLAYLGIRGFAMETAEYTRSPDEDEFFGTSWIHLNEKSQKNEKGEDCAEGSDECVSKEPAADFLTVSIFKLVDNAHYVRHPFYNIWIIIMSLEFIVSILFCFRFFFFISSNGKRIIRNIRHFKVPERMKRRSSRFRNLPSMLSELRMELMDFDQWEYEIIENCLRIVVTSFIISYDWKLCSLFPTLFFLCIFHTMYLLLRYHFSAVQTVNFLEPRIQSLRQFFVQIARVYEDIDDAEDSLRIFQKFLFHVPHEMDDGFITLPGQRKTFYMTDNWLISREIPLNEKLKISAKNDFLAYIGPGSRLSVIVTPFKHMIVNDTRLNAHLFVSASIVPISFRGRISYRRIEETSEMSFAKAFVKLQRYDPRRCYLDAEGRFLLVNALRDGFLESSRGSSGDMNSQIILSDKFVERLIYYVQALDVLVTKLVNNEEVNRKIFEFILGTLVVEQITKHFL